MDASERDETYCAHFGRRNHLSVLPSFSEIRGQKFVARRDVPLVATYFGSFLQRFLPRHAWIRGGYTANGTADQISVCEKSLPLNSSGRLRERASA